MLTQLSSFNGDLPGTRVLYAPETTLDGAPVGGPEPTPEPIGTGVEAIVPPTIDTPAVGEPPAAPSPYLEYELPDGTKQSFESAEKLQEHAKKNFWMQKDYSSKTEAHKLRLQQLEAREKSYEERVAKLKELDEQYNGFRKFMEERPQEFQRLQQSLNSPASPQDVVGQVQSMMEAMENRFNQRFESYDTRFSDQDFNEQKQKLHAEIGATLDGYDPEAVEEFLAAQDQNDQASLFRMAHFARRGMGSPEEQARTEATLRGIQQKNAGIVGGSSAPPPEPSFGSVEEGRKAAARDLV